MKKKKIRKKQHRKSIIYYNIYSFSSSLNFDPSNIESIKPNSKNSESQQKKYVNQHNKGNVSQRSNGTKMMIISNINSINSTNHNNNNNNNSFEINEPCRRGKIYSETGLNNYNILNFRSTSHHNLFSLRNNNNCRNK
jgi:hypothetical protein